MKPNWWQFRNPTVPGQAPTSFGELLSVPSEPGRRGRVFQRWGSVCTYGESECVELLHSAEETMAVLAEQFDRQGLECVRKWHFDSETFDVELLQRELVDGVRAAFSWLKQKHGAPTGLALNTDSGAETVVLISNFDALKTSTDDVIWCPDEWTCWDGGEFLDLAYRLVLSQHRDDLSRFDFDGFRRSVSEAMRVALEELVEDGTLGTEAERDQMVVSVHVSSDDIDEDAVRRLNTKAVAARFERFRESWKSA